MTLTDFSCPFRLALLIIVLFSLETFKPDDHTFLTATVPHSVTHHLCNNCQNREHHLAFLITHFLQCQPQPSPSIPSFPHPDPLYSCPQLSWYPYILSNPINPSTMETSYPIPSFPVPYPILSYPILFITIPYKRNPCSQFPFSKLNLCHKHYSNLYLPTPHPKYPSCLTKLLKSIINPFLKLSYIPQPSNLTPCITYQLSTTWNILSHPIPSHSIPSYPSSSSLANLTLIKQSINKYSSGPLLRTQSVARIVFFIFIFWLNHYWMFRNR